MTATKTAVLKKAKPAPKDAIALLESDHEEVAQLFVDFEKARTSNSKKTLVAEICRALTVHMQIEEEIFYPTIKKALKDQLLIPEATVEHAGVRGLITQIDGIEPDGDLYDAKVKVLSEYVKHHIKEEHAEMFPVIKSSALDIVELGERMTARKDALMAIRA